MAGRIFFGLESDNDSFEAFMRDANYSWEFRVNVLLRLSDQTCGPEEYMLLGMATLLKEEAEYEATLARMRASREQAAA